MHRVLTFQKVVEQSLSLCAVPSTYDFPWRADEIKKWRFYSYLDDTLCESYHYRVSHKMDTVIVYFLRNISIRRIVYWETWPFVLYTLYGKQKWIHFRVPASPIIDTPIPEVLSENPEKEQVRLRVWEGCNMAGLLFHSCYWLSLHVSAKTS